MIADLRYALRQLRRSPGFALTAALTLAIGIGVNAVVFSVLNALVIRPLAVPHSEQLIFVQRKSPDSPINSYPDYADWRDRNQTLSGLAAYGFQFAGLDTGKNPSTVMIYEASGNYFDVIGVQPYLGRFFHSADEHGPDSSPYIVLSYAFWHGHFNDDAGIIGKVVQLNKHPFTVIGVAQPHFRGTELFFSPALWVPMVNAPQLEGWDLLHQRGKHSIFVIGRLKPGVAPAAADADLTSIAGQLASEYPTEDQGLKIALTRPGLAGDTLRRPIGAFLGGVMLLSGMILLASCANLGSLFAARAADRSREMAIRMALGATRRRIVRQLLTEAVVIALLGGVAGVLGGNVLLRGLSNWHPFPNIPIDVPVDPDAITYAAALSLSVLSGVLFGVAAARQAVRANNYELVKAGTSSALVWRRLTLRDVLLAAQIALCAVLVTASIVAVRGLERSLHSNFGFTPQGAMTAEMDLNMGGYSDEKADLFQRQLLQEVEQIPGVSAAYADWLPLGLSHPDRLVYRNGTTDLRPGNSAADSFYFRVSPGYLEAARTILLAGRDFTWHDDANSPAVAIVNETFAHSVFGSVDKAIGNYFVGGDGKRKQVVGIVENGAYRNLTEDPRPAMFLPIMQEPDSNTTLVVRSDRPASRLAEELRTTVARLDSELPVTVRTWPDAMDLALFPARVASVALGVMGALGAMLAVTGVFGMD